MCARAFDGDEGERRLLVVDAQCGAPVPLQRLALHGGLVRREDEVVAVEHEPDRHDVRCAVLAGHGELARPGAGLDERPPFVVGHRP